MNSAGWIVMIASTGSVISLFIWCIYKVLTIPDETEHMHGFEQTPPDAKN